jgi:sugar (pentulose or hexulose) kinase
LALGVRSRAGEEAFVQTKMRGATRWQKQPAFDLRHVPSMILDLLDALENDGWSFDGLSLSFSVRQHDMVLLDTDGQRLIPALSWQCNAASNEVAKLRQLGAESVVGRIEERFILPKLMWALSQAPEMARQVRQVMTTGDWIAALLTGQTRLSTSDALSNALLNQKTKKLAADVMKRAQVDPTWFPKVLQSGTAVGHVTARDVAGADARWMQVKQRLEGATVVAGLGDNHATGVGCGLEEEDFQTMIVSAGTSGTINRVSPPQLPLAGQAACFEFYRNRLLLMMLADCCKWYDRFVAAEASEYVDGLDRLNALVLQADLGRLRRVLHSGGKESGPPDWSALTTGEKAASTQFSIMVELLLRVKGMLAEVIGAEALPDRYVLTGGLSQSEFFQQVFHAGIKLLVPSAKVLISARKGPLRYQTAAYGALLNAMRPEDVHAARRLCPTRAAKHAEKKTREILAYFLRSAGVS